MNKPHLACPSCGESFATAAFATETTDLHCVPCQQTYFSVGTIPWLLVEPQFQLAQWKHQATELVAQWDKKIDRLQGLIQSQEILGTTKIRLENTRAAYIEHKKILQTLLSPLGKLAPQEIDFLVALANELPKEQNLLSYESNIHRDWAGWGNAENTQCLEILKKTILHSPTKGLVLGSGASRLAYDLDQSFNWDLLVGLDINPLLFFVAQNLFNDNSMELHEFPNAPLDLKSFLAKNHLQIPGGPVKKLQLVFGDIWNPPFQARSFDYVLAPWFLDILKYPMSGVIKRINSLLETNGTFVFFGSLVMNTDCEENRFLEEELVENFTRGGFKVVSKERMEIPYLNTPHSSQTRLEKVLLLSATKITDTPADTPYVRKKSRLPDWILDPSVPVPLTEKVEARYLSHSIQSEMLKLVDGKTSLKEISNQAQLRYQMNAEEADQAVTRFLWNLFSG